MTTGNLADLRSRLYEAYASQHAGFGGDEAVGLVYRHDIRPLLPPAIRVADLLLRMGADVRAADPLVTETAVLDPAVARVEATPEQIAAADLVVLLTDHDAFSAADVGRHACHVLDCRRVLSGPNVETL